MMKNKIAELKARLADGVLPAMATPLEADGYTVNVACIPELIAFLESTGIKGLFVGGTTGEGILLTPQERMRLHQTAVTHASLPVIVHIGANRVDTAAALAHHAVQIGADAIAAVTPYYYGFHEDGLLHYYQEIAAAAPGVPLLLYDIPHMAINGISAPFAQRIQSKIPSVAGIKTSRGDMAAINILLTAFKQPALAFAGKEPLALGAMSYGFDGLVSGLSTAVPEPFVALVNAFVAGDMIEAQKQQRLINTLLAFIPDGFRIGAIKQILKERGIDVGSAVPPRPMPTAPIWTKMQTAF